MWYRARIHVLVLHLRFCFPASEYYKNVTVHIQYAGKVNVLTSVVVFYDCEVYGRAQMTDEPCSHCLSAHWGCSWSVDRRACEANTLISRDKRASFVTDHAVSTHTHTNGVLCATLSLSLSLLIFRWT